MFGIMILHTQHNAHLFDIMTLVSSVFSDEAHQTDVRLAFEAVEFQKSIGVFVAKTVRESNISRRMLVDGSFSNRRSLQRFQSMSTETRFHTTSGFSPWRCLSMMLSTALLAEFLTAVDAVDRCGRRETVGIATEFTTRR